MENTTENALVSVMFKQPMTTSLKVAEYFQKRHDRVLRAITASIQALPKNEESKKAFIKTTYQDETGKQNPMYLLNRDGFSFVAMGFTGKKAAEFKWTYIQEFNRMEAEIQRINLNKQNAEWLEKRKMNKIGNKSMTDALKPVVELAERQGSKNGNKIYMNVQRLQNKIIGANAGQRDQLELWQMNALDTLQFIAKTIAAGLVAQGADWHQVYKDIKLAYENYSRLSFLEHRQEPVYLA